MQSPAYPRRRSAFLRLFTLHLALLAIAAVTAAAQAGPLLMRQSVHAAANRHQPNQKQPGIRKARMKLSFERSGGFAGMATAVKGEVTLDGNTGKVTAADYQRDLAPGELASLRTGLEHLQQTPPAASRPMPDQYVYDLRLESDGHAQTLQGYGDTANPVLAWVRQECERIWDHRTAQK